MIEEQLLKSEEKAVFALRSLYRKYGYLPYKMSKFEEYELYIRNKDFLVSDRIITFNDTNGKLMALKPDVTLSIIKNSEDKKGVKQKVFYNENVYRVSKSTKNYKEIMQAGLECIGDIDLYDIFEAVTLAVKSLSLISDDFVLEISHLGILSAILDEVCKDELFQSQALEFISQKNTHDLSRLCEKFEISAQKTADLVEFVSTYGKRDEVIKKLKNIYKGESLEELETLSNMLNSSEFSEKIIFDFSVVNDMSYYNGIVFKGFLSEICEGVLSGGQYDNLMQKMDRKSGAVGFALYLDLLEQLSKPKKVFDVDVLLIYGENDDKQKVAQKVNEFVNKGLSVSAQKCVPEKLRFKQKVEFLEGKNNA